MSGGSEAAAPRPAHPYTAGSASCAGPLPRRGTASGPKGSRSRPSRAPQSLRPPPSPGAASPPPSLRRILQGAGLRLEAAAPSGRPPGSAGLRAAGGSDDTASRVLLHERLRCALGWGKLHAASRELEPGAESCTERERRLASPPVSQAATECAPCGQSAELQRETRRTGRLRHVQHAIRFKCCP